jgi:ABC-type nitrate/sulfonate/bicarbonate transport system substrate-binding protein
MIASRNTMAAALLAALFAMSGIGHAQETKLTVMVFSGVQNMPVIAAQTKGFFAKRGLSVEVLPAPSSEVLRTGLMEGKHQIVHSAVDNAVAMAEVAKADISILMGGDNGWNRFFVQADTPSVKDLRGKTVIVDAPNTAYAFQVYQVLKLNGLNKGDYEVRPLGGTPRRFEAIKSDKSAGASTLNPPFSILARRAGLKDMGEIVQMIGPYQATAAWVMKPWAAANADALVRYIQAYVEGLRWTLDPANKAEAIDLIAARFKLESDIAAEAYAVATDPKSGFAKDAKLDMDGLNNVLKLRADWTGATPGAPDRYIDLSYHQKALSGL